jgi:predicted nucleotide-binding protein
MSKINTRKIINDHKKTETKRGYLSQSDVPSYSLEEALRIPRAIVENYAGGPVSPIQLAQALDVTPTSGPFRMLAGASIAYGLTSGGYNASEIKLERLGTRITRPLEEGDDISAKREAFLKPRIIREFITKYNGSQIPRLDIAYNVLTTMGVPSDKTEEVLELIVDQATKLGFITDIKGKKFVELKNMKVMPFDSEEVEGEEQEIESLPEQSITVQNFAATHRVTEVQKSNLIVQIDNFKKKRVYITHGRDMSFVEPIRKLLKFGEMEAVVSVEKQTVSKPVPDKVMSDMRSCGAAIIHVDAEQQLVDKDANEHLVLNPNVLIEIGAAMALFGRRFILLVKDGVKLPSNLQGLYEVRYNGDQLSGDVTIKLLEAINDIKTQLLPEEKNEN